MTSHKFCNGHQHRFWCDDAPKAGLWGGLAGMATGLAIVIFVVFVMSYD